MILIEEYKKSLKMVEAEEILNLVLYRLIAFVLVKLIYRLPIRPNQVTYGSLTVGILPAVEFAQGTANGANLYLLRMMSWQQRIDQHLEQEVLKPLDSASVSV